DRMPIRGEILQVDGNERAEAAEWDRLRKPRELPAVSREGERAEQPIGRGVERPVAVVHPTADRGDVRANRGVPLSDDRQFLQQVRLISVRREAHVQDQIVVRSGEKVARAYGRHRVLRRGGTVERDRARGMDGVGTRRYEGGVE